MDSEKLTWKNIVADALSQLGGQGHLSQINEAVENNQAAIARIASNPTWQATIRRVVRQYKIFRPLGKGVYELLQEVPVKSEPQEFTEEPEIDHSIAQGMLATVGKLYGYETYVPPHDQTTRRFQDKPLGDFVSVSDCTDIFKGPNLSKIREIDSLWFDEDDYGLFPVYAFEIEQTTKVKSGLDRLLKIPKRFTTQFFIIAPSAKEEDLFDRYVNQTPFRDFRDRFSFRLYEDLEELYNAALLHSDKRERFGIAERGR